MSKSVDVLLGCMTATTVVLAAIAIFSPETLRESMSSAVEVRPIDTWKLKLVRPDGEVHSETKVDSYLEPEVEYGHAIGYVYVYKKQRGYDRTLLERFHIPAGWLCEIEAVISANERAQMDELNDVLLKRLKEIDKGETHEDR